MIHSAAPFSGFGRRLDVINGSQEMAIHLSSGAPFNGPLLQMRQLDVQNRCLHRVQPAIVAFYGMMILLTLTVVANHAYSIGKRFVVRRDCPTFPTRAQVLAGVETE